MVKNSRYWEERAKKEREWQEAQLKHDESFNKILHEHYNQALVDIDRDIDAQFNRLAKANRSTVEEARKAVSQADIQAYQTEAKKVVDEANKMRAAKKTPTYNDWDDEVNERMRIYNATMRINRLEYLKSQIGLEMVRAGYRIDDDLQAKLSKDYTDELKRQASILGTSMKGSLWTSKEVQMQIMAQTNGATFSQRLWQNQDALKARLDAVLNLGIIEGSSNAEMARRVKDLIKDTVTNHQYVAERIARTESARVQHAAQLKSLKDNGYEYCKWYAEPGACKFCVEIAETDEENIEPGVYTVKDVPMVPVHPNCRCSIGAYVPDEAELQNSKQFNTEKGAGLRVGNNSVDMNYIHSKQFRNKFSRISNNKKLNQQLYKQAVAMLTHRQNSDGEDSYIFNSNGKIVNKAFGKENKLEVGVPRKVVLQLKDRYGERTMVGMHNHPTNIPPTGSDFAVANSRSYDFGVVVTHDGRIFKYSLNSKNILPIRFDLTVENIRSQHYNWTVDRIFNEAVKKLGGEGFQCEEIK